MFGYLLVFIVFLNGIQSCESRTSVVRATIQPRQPLLVWSGETIILTCNLSRSSVNVNASDLEFYSSSPEINEKFRTQIINEWAIRTVISDVHRNMSSENISCRFQNDTLDEVTVLVSDRIHCVVMNWEGMICTWENFRLSYNTNQTLLFNSGYCRSTKSRCPHSSFNGTHGQCEWKNYMKDPANPFMLTTLYCFAIKIVSSFAVLSKQIGVVEVKRLVKPNQISDFRIHSTLCNRSIFMNWTSPNKDEWINYRVAWISKWSVAKEENTTTTAMVLHNLIPNTEYTVTIDCIPILINGERAGFWSDPITQKFTTPSDVPGASPKLTPGGFLESSLNASHRNVELFFQPPDDYHAHGQLIEINVKYWSSDSFDSVFMDETRMRTAVILRKDVDYTFTIEAKTDCGYNKNLTMEPIIISNQTKRLPFPKQFVVKTDGNGSYFFSWIPISDVSTYTLYWCKSHIRLFSCLDVLQWKTILPNQTSAEMKLSVLPGRTLLFFISAEKNLSDDHVISSGMLMSNCTFLRNGELKPPHGFRVSEVHAESLLAEWSKLDDTSCQRSAFLAAYIILYCSIQNCHQTNVTIEVNSSVESIEITGLEPDTTYSIMIKSVSDDGKESYFDRRNATTTDPRSWMGYYSVVIGVVIGVLCCSCAAIVAVTYLRRWYKKKFDQLQVVIPEKHSDTKAGISLEHSCYSNFGSPMASKYYANGLTLFGHGSETQVLFQKINTFSVASSSCYTNETSLQSSSSAETSASENVSLKSSNVSGYNFVVEQPCTSASVTHTNSGTNHPNGGSLLDVDDLVFITSTDA